MIDLANARGANPWFCMPHLADDDYVRQFARLVKERLRPDLKAYVEYSNEVWNWIYPATHFADAEGKRLKLGDPAFGRYYSQRSVEVFRIWEEELGRDRLVRVLASQFVNAVADRAGADMEGRLQARRRPGRRPLFRPRIRPARRRPRPSRTLTAPQLLDRLAAEVDGPEPRPDAGASDIWPASTGCR